MNEIDATAADWAARVDGGTPDPQTEVALERWLAEDVRHVGAFARAQALLLAFEDAVGMPDDTTLRHGRSSVATNRRRFLWGGGLAAGLAAVSVAGLWLARADRAYATERGETRVVALANGATLTLNTLSRARVAADPACRITLIEGEGLVRASGQLTTATCAGVDLSAENALFSLRQTEEGGLLTVFEGVVSVSGLDTSVQTGGRVRLTPGAPTVMATLDEGALERALAWRDGRIAFENATLVEASQEFARYSATPIRVAAGPAQDIRISGLFAAEDPAAFARAVAVTSGLRAESRDGAIYLSGPGS